MARRPHAKLKGKYTADCFLPCEFCLGFYLKTSLWAHAGKCAFKPENTQPSKNFVRNARIMLSPFVKTITEEETTLSVIFDGMKETTANPGITKLCRQDPLIKEFALSMTGRIGDAGEQRIKDVDNVRTKVRTVGRLLKELHTENSNEESLSFFVTGPRYKAITEAVKRLAISTDSPQMALVLGHYIKHIALLKISRGIQNGDVDAQSEGRDFQFLFQAHWNNQVSCVAQRRQRLRKLNKQDDLPTTEDLLILRQWIQKESEILCALSQPTDIHLTWLSKLTLVRIVLFNKRRISEVQEMKVSDFIDNQMNNQGVDSEIYKSLDISEKALAKRYMLTIKISCDFNSRLLLHYDNTSVCYHCSFHIYRISVFFFLFFFLFLINNV